MRRAAAALSALCALSALPARAAPPSFAHLSLLGGPRENLPWTRHDPLTLLSGEDKLVNKPKPWSQEAYVVPQRPGKNQVRYFDFKWRDYDYLDDDGSAGIRFYFYDREYPVARIAAGLVRQSWAYLSDRFNYKPSFKVPYVLYNTYREFLETNVFDVQEGTLGVTSPQDLRMTLSYSGDRQLFTIVSTHEMTHQFQIQKVAERAASAGQQPQQMNARWQEWVRKRAYPAFLQSKQDLPDVTELRLPDELDWFVSSRDGNLIFYRGVERETARAKLVLIDRRDPSSSKQIAIDQHPGTESLHPILRSVMAVCDTAVGWFAQSGAAEDRKSVV